MTNRHIKKVAILGSGVMGSRIACHFAGIGVQVLLMDIAFKPENDDKKSSRNKIVNDHLQDAIKSNPSPIYKKSFLDRITIGNFDDDFEKINDSDWIIEVVVEKIEIKKTIFEKVDQFRKKGSIVSSNTSGIPIYMMAEGRSEDFQNHFCGTHFFNPPRYLQLLEIIPTEKTKTDVIDFLMHYGALFLGKTTVKAKDTPAFIGNRIGVFSIATILNFVSEHNLSVDAIDQLTGPVVGRPKSATFRTADLVGIDTLALVANSLAQNLPNDSASHLFHTPEFINKMIENKWLGNKTKQGFYKKVNLENGKSEIWSLDLNSMTYQPSKKASFPDFDQIKSIENLKDRFTILFQDETLVGEFYRKTMFPLFAYASKRIPEIADHLYQIDDAIEAGFNWELGVFKIWDAYGLQNGIKGIESMGEKPAQWVYDMAEKDNDTFYKTIDGKQMYYDISSNTYKIIPGTENLIYLNNISDENKLWHNAGCTIWDIGDGILNLEFHSKSNTIGSEIIEGINKVIDLAESAYKGVVIYNNGTNFSLGANIGLIYMMAIEQEYDELNFAIQQFQNTMMRVRYSSIPVVAAPHNMALGGGCELCLHADMVVAHSELYMGLVEFGVGVIPGGGGTKEMTLRLSEELSEGDIRINDFRQQFLTIGQTKVSTSAFEAFDLGYLRQGHDIIVMNRNRQLAEAKAQCLQLAERGYTQPIERYDILVLGKEALGIAYLGANTMMSGNYISEHDTLISQKLAWVMSGGDLSIPTKVSERYLLQLERTAFIELCTKRKTLERLQSIITTNKVLRN